MLVPTRELCMQYMAEIQKIAAHTDLVPYAVYGGFDKCIQVSTLKHKVHILVATPGRLIDLLYDGVLSFAQVKCAILDEADELLKVGFLEDIEFILSCILHEHQTLLFSATMPEDIKKLAHDCMRNPQHLSLITERAGPESIEHYFSYCHPKQKQAELVKYLEGKRLIRRSSFVMPGTRSIRCSTLSGKTLRTSTTCTRVSRRISVPESLGSLGAASSVTLLQATLPGRDSIFPVSHT